MSDLLSRAARVAKQQGMAMTETELDCRWEWWRAAFDFFSWSIAEGSAAVSGFMWGQEYDPIRGW